MQQQDGYIFFFVSTKMLNDRNEILTSDPFVNYPLRYLWAIDFIFIKYCFTMAEDMKMDMTLSQTTKSNNNIFRSFVLVANKMFGGHQANYFNIFVLWIADKMLWKYDAWLFLYCFL